MGAKNAYENAYAYRESYQRRLVLAFSVGSAVSKAATTYPRAQITDALLIFYPPRTPVHSSSHSGSPLYVRDAVPDCGRFGFVLRLLTSYSPFL